MTLRVGLDWTQDLDGVTLTRRFPGRAGAGLPMKQAVNAESLSISTFEKVSKLGST